MMTLALVIYIYIQMNECVIQFTRVLYIEIDISIYIDIYQCMLTYALVIYVYIHIMH